MLSTFEIFIFTLYLATIFICVAAIAYLNPGKSIRESITVLDTDEKFVQAEFEEPESSESEKEFTMEENPMLRHRNLVEQVD